jgi:hypothetical protein
VRIHFGCETLPEGSEHVNEKKRQIHEFHGLDISVDIMTN